MLGPREKVRVGAVLAVAAAEINKRIVSGEKVRTDGFFDEKPSGRSHAEEVAESVLLTIQGLGTDIYNLMRLVPIPEEDIAPINTQLQ